MNKDDYNKNRKNNLNVKINNTNSSLINKSINSIDNLNNEKSGSGYSSINSYNSNMLFGK